MDYLDRQAEPRAHPSHVLEGVRSVVMAGCVYGRPDDPAAPEPLGKIARYARGGDYHELLWRRLETLLGWLQAECPGATGRAVADSAPLMERDFARLAGLGWIGKNTMLIRPGEGSFFFIGSVLTDLDLEPTPAPPMDHCGTCTRCLDACPTEAIVAPRVLAATRCISYVTIESKAPIAAGIAERLGGWAFGCDICNDVGPWNERFARPADRPAYGDRGAIQTGDPEFFDRMSEEEFTALFRDTPLERPGLERMRRNYRAAFASLAPDSPS
jgi:epoxyqueuosine reductase